MADIFISVNDIVVSEADGTANFIVTLNQLSTRAVAVRYDTFGQTTQGNSDFIDTNGILNFAPAETTQTVQVTLVDNTTVEDLEIFTFQLSSPVNAILSRNLASATIIDNDTIGTPNIFVSILTVDETDGQAFFSIVLDKASASDVTVSYATQDVTATTGSDYQAVNGTVTFTPGQTVRTIPVTLLDDSQNEANENFNLVFSNAINATLAQAQVKVFIGASDGPITGGQPLISVNDIVVSEADGTANFIVTLNQPSNRTVFVSYDTFGQTTQGDSDFIDTNGILNFAPGETTQTVQVTLVENTTREGLETFTFRLSLPTNATLAKNLASATIIDNDTIGTPNISVSDLTVDEKDGQAFFSIILDKASTRNITVNYTTQDGTATAGSDYQAVNGTVTFALGQTAKTIPITLLDDSQNEANENFNFILSSATNATLAQSQAKAFIGANDSPVTGEQPLISIGDIVVSEADATATFLVTLNRPSTQTVGVSYDTFDQTAQSNSDFIDTNGILNFASGETTKTVRVVLINDNTVETNETFGLSLSSPTNATLSRNQAFATIIDNDTIGTPNISVSSLTVNEKDGQAFFAIVLDKASASNITVNYTTQDGTATTGSDYQAVNGTITFTPGQTARTIPITLLDDSQNEANETFTLTLSNPTDGATIVNATGTIRDGNNSPTNDPLTAPVYRFYNAESRGHFFTTNAQERDTVIANPQWGYTYEDGFGFKASTTPGQNLLEVFRFYNAQSRGHFFTINPQERDTVLANPQLGYTYEEGLGFYAYGIDANLGSDVYRFYNTQSKGHFFTINPQERDTVLANPQWQYTFEGVGFEASP